MELLMHPASRSNQPTFKVYNVKDYKFITTYTVEIDNQGFIKDFIVNSESSAKLAEVLSKIHTLYSDWNQAYKALENYNKVFTTFKE